MIVKNVRGRWKLSLGALGAFVVAGAVTLAGRPVAVAQQPQRTPEQLFNRTCGRCHNDPDEPDNRINNKGFTEQRMIQQIRQGSKRMRAIPPTRLPDSDLPTLMVYLRSIGAVR